MRPAVITMFGRVLMIALAIDLVANLLSWQAFVARFVALGFSDPTLLVLVSCLASPLVGLLLWFLIARRRSVVAKWVMTALVALGVAMLVNTLAHGVAAAAWPLLAAAAVAEGLKVVAVAQLFRREAAAWFGDEKVAAA